METCYIRLAPLLDDGPRRGVDDDQVYADGPVPWPNVVERHCPAGLRWDSLLEETHLVLVGYEVGRLPCDRHGLVGGDVPVRGATAPRNDESCEENDDERREPEDPAVA